MAKRYIGVDQGGRDVDVTEDSSTTSKNVELVIDLAQGMSRQEVLLAIEYIENKILNDQWPPA